MGSIKNNLRFMGAKVVKKQQNRASFYIFNNFVNISPIVQSNLERFYNGKFFKLNSGHKNLFSKFILGYKTKKAIL